MSAFRYFVGLDIAAEQFFASIGITPWRLVVPATEFANTREGFDQFLAWLAAHDCPVAETIVCMEATGVYGEALAYALASKGFCLAVEPPLQVKRAFKPQGPKTDAVDSQQIAEYACRFVDRLHLWQPRAELLEQLNVLVTTREQLVKQRTAHKNSLQALKRKVVHSAVAESALQRLISELDAQIKTIEKEIRRLFKQDPPFQQWLGLLLTIPGIGLLGATQFLLATAGDPQRCEAKHLAAHWGIAPLPHQSGKAIHGRTTSRHSGPPIARKLLHLAARSVCTHNPKFRTYYLRKLQAGKPKRLVLNNVGNKLLKVMCAVISSKTPYLANYRLDTVAAA